MYSAQTRAPIMPHGPDPIVKARPYPEIFRDLYSTAPHELDPFGTVVLITQVPHFCNVIPGTSRGVNASKATKSTDPTVRKRSDITLKAIGKTRSTCLFLHFRLDAIERKAAVTRRVMWTSRDFYRTFGGV